MKADLRISIKDYRRNKALRVTPKPHCHEGYPANS